ncbi:100 kDa protein [Southern Psittacara leucophthalmus aviadenovirus]|uniref:100 kDa protein n=1 Tax=Southern Psittacara leucophthalmus aviadenovirus TaxID=2604330 RepID=A0AAF1DB84_9ADEN|nr:100 kDa protein [Southern Psittacara leucophthalmus aviadenovirus]QEJ80777.1 100 kDa protein [Southern Psittacara leucophthalmus aviadenovirus]
MARSPAESPPPRRSISGAASSRGPSHGRESSWASSRSRRAASCRLPLTPPRPRFRSFPSTAPPHRFLPPRDPEIEPSSRALTDASTFRMVLGWKEKALFMLNMVLKAVQDRPRWLLFTALLRMHLKHQYRQGLPRNISPDSPPADTEETAVALLDLLGENRSLLAAFRISEEIEHIMTNEPEKAQSLVDKAFDDTDSSGSESEMADQDHEEVVSNGESPEDPEGDLPNQHETLDGYKAEADSSPGASRADDDESGQSTVSDSDYSTSHETVFCSDSGDSTLTAEGSDGEREQSVIEADGSSQPEPAAPCEPELGGGEEAVGDDVPDSYRPEAARRAPEHEAEPEANDEPLCEKSEPDAAPNFRKCIERQAMLLSGCLKDLLETTEAAPLSVDNLQFQLERFIFNPSKNVPVEHQEVRHNFYPPFLTPKAISNYHIFSVTAPIPMSCKANRSGSRILNETMGLSYFKYLPKWRPNVEIQDGLGDEVTPVGDLPEEMKMVPLVSDVSRLQWSKSRAEHINFFSYPSLHFPPKIARMLMETLLQPFADEVKDRADEPKMCVTDDELACIVDPLNKMRPDDRLKAMNTRRTMVSMAVRYCAQLELMQRVLREPSSVKKCQEVLHHTLHHGYVSIIREVSKVNLSNYATYHGVTYNNPLNNCVVSKLLEGSDRDDYIVDTIYLFLVINWQTAMGMWTQALQEETIQIYSEMFTKWKRCIYAMNSINEMANAIVNILMDGDRLVEVMRNGLPNFCTQSQISNFRHFIMERSNVPLVAAQFLPSDFVPLTFKESAPLLWDQVYLLRVACFLANHGGYLYEDPDPRAGAFKSYCPCNLCSPHRMPQDNMALHNEMLAINTFEIRSAEGKTFKMTPEIWTNAYLDKFEPKDYHPFTVLHYVENQSRFSANLTGSVTTSPEIISMIRQIQESREEFMLTKGKGVYKDPVTGEVISHNAQAPRQQQAGLQPGKAVPISGAGVTGGVGAPTKAARAIQNTASDDGSENDRRESQSGGVWSGASPVPAQRLGARCGHRRRVNRKSGHRNFGVGGRAGSLAAIQESPEAPRKILTRQHKDASRTTEEKEKAPEGDDCYRDSF